MEFDEAQRVREGAGLFCLSDRGLLRVRGSDQVRWLDGMLSNDVASLEVGPERSGCYALLLTRQGRIVSDIHVLKHTEELWLELAAEAVASVVETLEGFIVADDVELQDASAEFGRLAVEGAGAPALVDAAAGHPLALAADAWAPAQIGGVECVVASWGVSGGSGRQLLVEGPHAVDTVIKALEDAAAGSGLVEGTPGLLEQLRVEAGVPRFGAELGPDVLPAEAGLGHAISTEKGCYTGQEVVERMRSRDRVSHRLVGLVVDGEPPAPGQPLGFPAGIGDGGATAKAVGEVTSAVRGSQGSMALAFVRAAHTEPGTLLAAGGHPARVVALPFTGPGPSE
ncbi:hypothetical protein MK489_17470 [Myxococcota bacterium]|nr:hypothetical protein [Myxococcota bacterium]